MDESGELQKSEEKLLIFFFSRDIFASIKRFIHILKAFVEIERYAILFIYLIKEKFYILAFIS